MPINEKEGFWSPPFAVDAWSAETISEHESGSSAGAGTQLLWAVDIFARGLFRSRIVGKIVKLAFFWLTYMDDLVPKRFNIDAACGCYFLGRKATKVISPKEAVHHYQGAQ